MSNGIGKIKKKASHSKNAASQNKRLDALEQGVQLVVGAVNSVISRQGAVIQELQQTADAHSLIIEAIGDMLGTDRVQESINTVQQRRQKQRSEQQQAALDAGLANGTVKSVENVTERSEVVGIERDDKGEVVPPGRIQVGFSNLVESAQKELLGKSVGTIVSTPVGGTFEVTGIYEVAAPAVVEEKATSEGEAISSEVE